MRFFALAAALISTFLTASAASLDTTDVCLSELCGFSQGLSHPQEPTIFVKRSALSNADRLRHGMSPAPPTRRSTARRSTTSSVPSVIRRGTVEVSDAATGAFLGYISAGPFNGYIWRYDPSPVNVQVLDMIIPVGATSAKDIQLSLGFTASPQNDYFLGLVQGRDNTNADISPDSFHYAWISATRTNGASGSPPAVVENSYTNINKVDRASESFVWSWESATNALTLQWINTDGSRPKTEVWTQGTALYVGGSEAAFAVKYPTATTPLSFKFVPETLAV